MKSPFVAVFAIALVCGVATASAQSAIVIRADDGGMIQADEYGDGHRGVVLAHGGRFDRTSWKPQALVLVSAGFRVIAIDFRAAVEMRAGRETPCLYDSKCLARDIVPAVRHLKRTGAKTVSIVGGSLGGGAAARATIDAPGEIDRVVLLAHMLIDTPEKIGGRKLFIIAKDDRGGNDQPRLPGIRAQYDRAPDPKELLIVDGAAHAQAMFDSAEGPRIMREIVRFLAAP
jgi:dienelactone hydrolase